MMYYDVPPWSGESVHTVVIENGITRISGHAFFRRSNLAEIVIPNSVTSIGSGAFSDCSSLTGITIPDSVASDGPGNHRAFNV